MPDKNKGGNQLLISDLTDRNCPLPIQEEFSFVSKQRLHTIHDLHFVLEQPFLSP